MLWGASASQLLAMGVRVEARTPQSRPVPHSPLPPCSTPRAISPPDSFYRASPPLQPKMYSLHFSLLLSGSVCISPSPVRARKRRFLAAPPLRLPGPPQPALSREGEAAPGLRGAGPTRPTLPLSPPNQRRRVGRHNPRCACSSVGLAPAGRVRRCAFRT